jgi:diguanylate cyclase (GGDEF)-like protein/PAS domain S-box-containing protein
MPSAPPHELTFDDPPSTRQVEDLLHPHRKALAALMHSEALSRGDVAGALELVTEVAARVLRVERASVWRFRDDRGALECANLFERTPQTHKKGGSLLAASFPSYFTALDDERSIAAHDARADKRTREFSETYLEPNGIGAMLDAPVFVRGKMVGVVCHEHVGGPRRWLHWEELIAGSIADFVALAFEAAENNLARQKLREHQQHLEALVAARTEELTRANESLQREIAERERAEALLRHSEQNLKTLFEISPTVLVLSRASDQRVILANKETTELFEVPADQVVGQRAPDYYVDPTDRARLLARVQKEGHIESYQAQLKTMRGREFPALISARALAYDGEPAILVSAVDITEQKLTETRLRELATLDSLTGCYNRRHFFDLGSQEFDRSARYRHTVSVAMLDADHFKDINDDFGHDVGDRVLRAMADACRRTLRKTDILGRVGGEEFAIVFVETALAEARRVADRLLAEVAASSLTVSGAQVATTVSAGIVERRDEETLEAALKRADAALYRAKEAGRNQVAIG